MATRHHPLAKCEECPLYKKGTYVPTEFNGTQLHIVGEAPGATEAKTGRPFVGQSGKLLERTLNAHNISRRDCTLTNTVSCRPRGNQTPTDDAIEACRPRLESDLEQAHTILACGNTAASAILGRTTKITKDRVGPPKISPRYPNARIIPTIHPAACLRSPDSYPSLESDIIKVHSTGSTEWINPEYRVFGDSEDTTTGAKIALTQLLQREDLDPVAADIEVGEDKDEDFGHPEKLLSIALCYGESRAIVIGEVGLRETSVRELLAKVVRRKRTIWHNAAYDLAVLYRLGVVSSTAYWDTMLASYVLDERGGTHGLKYLAKELLGAPDWDSELKKAGGFEDAPRHILYKYNAYDAVATYRLFQLQQNHPEWDDNATKLNSFLLRAQHVLMHIAEEGIKIDTEALEELAAELEEEIYEKVRQLQEPEGLWLDRIPATSSNVLERLEIAKTKHKDKYFNPNSWQQVQTRLKKMGVRTKSTDEEHLTNIINNCNDKLRLASYPTAVQEYKRVRDFCQDILDYRKVGKLYGTYVKGVQTRLRKGRIHTTYLLHGTTTGRTSSRNINVQNVPRGEKIRKIYVPEVGKSFVQLDFKNIEGRIVFHLSGSESGRNILEEGRDIHGEVAAQAFGSSYTYEERVHAKSIVHGTNYGRTPHGIAKDPNLNVSLEKANELFKAYRNLVPEVFAWHKEMERRIFGAEDLVTPFGRKRRFALVTRDNREDVYKEGLAFLPQSIASDITLHACIALWERGFQIRNFVHDSVLIEAPDDKVKEVALDAQRIMENVATNVYTDWISFPVDFEIGKSWGNLE